MAGWYLNTPGLSSVKVNSRRNNDDKRKDQSKNELNSKSFLPLLVPNKRNYCPLRYPKCILWTGVVPLDKENVLQLQRWRLFENDHVGKLEMVTPTPKLRQVTPNRAMADHIRSPGGLLVRRHCGLQGEKNFVKSEPLLFQVIFTLVSPYKFRRRHGRVVRSLDL